jgi:integrase
MVSSYKATRAVSDGTLAKELGTLRAAIRHCRREHGWQVPDPTEGRIPSDQSDRMRWLTPREACRLVRAARASRQAPYLADLILLALHAGLRQGELLGLTWDRVDLRRWELHFLDASQQKGRRVDVVPINRHARDSLLRRAAWRAEHCPGCRYVFARLRQGACAPIESIRTSWAVACRKAGLEDVHPHDLRRTCASWLVQAGVPLRAVAALLRHRDIRTTMRYAHLSPDDARAGVQVLERSVGRSIGRGGADKISHLQSRSATRRTASD